MPQFLKVDLLFSRARRGERLRIKHTTYSSPVSKVNNNLVAVPPSENVIPRLLYRMDNMPSQKA